MKFDFTKMHGIGNDYVYVNCMDRELEKPEEIAIAVSPRHFSVGSDGLIMICASEDVGNADPQALVMAVNASLAVERVGMPEAQIILAQAVTYIATAPKSNRSCEAVFQAMQEVQATGDLPIPAHLQDAHYKGAAKLGHGTGYKYAHDYPNDYVEQQYLPYELSGREFYQPSGNGYEVKIREHMARIKKEAAEASSKNKES